MPALTNNSVGSFCGTSGAEATMAWSFLWKKSRKWVRISFRLGIGRYNHQAVDKGSHPIWEPPTLYETSARQPKEKDRQRKRTPRRVARASSLLRIVAS